jgi:hypothetical protein
LEQIPVDFDNSLNNKLESFDNLSIINNDINDEVKSFEESQHEQKYNNVDKDNIGKNNNKNKNNK